LELDTLKSFISKKTLTENTKRGGTVYVHNRPNIIGFVGFKHLFTIWFFNGVMLQDEKKVLINTQEGVTKSMRQWRFTSKEEIDEKTILQYSEEAIQL
jgi:uncharacterized protein YdeI (YjbR/CyaY-like superfamily)